MDNSIEKINKNGMYGDHVNVGTPGHIDHGSNSSIQELSPGTYEISADVNATRRSAVMKDYQPEEIEYEFDDWKKSPPAMWYSDQANGGKKRDKAKAKAQRKARKLNRRK